MIQRCQTKITMTFPLYIDDAMFRLHVLGMGNFFTEKYNHPCFLLEADGFLMLDAPANLPKMLRCYQKTLWCRSNAVEGIERFVMANMNRYAITHDHIDHAGGVETLAFWKFYLEGRRSQRLGEITRPTLVTTPEVLSDLERELMHKLRSSECYPGKELDFKDYFDVKDPVVEETYDDGEFRITPTTAHHSVSACGFYVEHDGKSVWYSGDTSFDRHLIAENDADLIIYDCSDIKAGGHTTREELMTLPAKVRKRMRIYHPPDSKIEHRGRDLFMVGTDLKVLRQYEFYDV